MNRSDVKTRVKEIYTRTEVGPLAIEDAEYMLSVMHLHNRAEHKFAGKKIVDVYMGRGKFEKCFFVKFEDGSYDSVSYHAIGKVSRGTTVHEKILHIQACRSALNIPKVPGKVAHHADMSFHELYNYFVNRYGMCRVVELPDGGAKLDDPHWEVEWIEYHTDLAVIQYVTPEEHKKIHHGGN